MTDAGVLHATAAGERGVAWDAPRSLGPFAEATAPLTTHPVRRDGWTPERRRRFLGMLAAGLNVRRACRRVGMSRQAAYTLRRRDPAFAQAWDGALSAARAAAEQAFLAMLPESLLRTMSELSGACNLRDGAGSAQDPVHIMAEV